MGYDMESIQSMAPVPSNVESRAKRIVKLIPKNRALTKEERSDLVNIIRIEIDLQVIEELKFYKESRRTAFLDWLLPWRK